MTSHHKHIEALDNQRVGRGVWKDWYAFSYLSILYWNRETMSSNQKMPSATLRVPETVGQNYQHNNSQEKKKKTQRGIKPTMSDSSTSIYIPVRKRTPTSIRYRSTRIDHLIFCHFDITLVSNPNFQSICWSGWNFWFQEFVCLLTITALNNDGN